MSTAHWLRAALILPSLFIVDKLLGWPLTLIYAAGVVLAVEYVERVPVPRSARAQLAAAVLTAAVVVVLFAAVYPLANVHVPFRGSDDDDALNAGVRALLAGRSPYLERTYLGSVLHQLPGEFVLAAPFVVMGTSALQNLAWLALFFLAVREERGTAHALRLAWVALLFSPVVVQQVVTGTGHMANAISVTLGLWWLTRASGRWRVAAAIAWGIALASRANFLWTVPLAFAWLARRDGWWTAVKTLMITCGTAAVITLPFYLAAPDQFGPLEAANRITRFNETWPHAGDGLLALMTLLAVALMFRRVDRSRLFLDAALVQAFPVAGGALLGLLQWGYLDVGYTSYFTFAAWFALMGITLSAKTEDLARERQTAFRDR
ncbi:MAG: hypothetical protein LBQ09_12850 [Acidobacteriaceae bacterium]|jgi:hypothetical protein|nr:hypothetical protein [Acidobacteriaceae bacterium]